MNERETQALQAAADAYARRTDQLRISEEEMAGQLTLEPEAPSDPHYVWFWNRMGRKGQLCRVLCRGTMNSALVEFPDGYRAVTSRNGLRRFKGPG